MKDFTQLADLASERLGGEVLLANDEFFAPKENLLKDPKPVFLEGKYTDRGKWMDGWETRRRRTPGHDWCIIRLGLPGTLSGAVVDTSFFTGNYPEQFSLEGCDLGALPYRNEKRLLASAQTKWIQLLPQMPLKGDAQNPVAVDYDGRVTHVRLRIYPDGGVARLRLHGEAQPDAKRFSRAEIDLVAVENGGAVLASSDQFYGAPRNMLMPGRAKNMGDGWETKRRRGPGFDWVILKLGAPGVIRRVEVDTAHFKGNFPESCSLEACYAEGAKHDGFATAPHVWKEILSRTKLRANHRHLLKVDRNAGPASHVRFNIFPDGGVSRLRIYGRAERIQPRVTALDSFNRLSPAEARKSLLACCAAKKWVDQMLKQRPFPDLPYALDTADKTWAALEPKDWLEAFRHHPPIGEKRAQESQSAAASKWSAAEQSAAQRGAPEKLAALAAANAAYHAKFGHVFLICATGKTSGEIFDNLQQRMKNDPQTELSLAAEEHRKITRLRLEKLLAP
jgi:allantoicase